MNHYREQILQGLRKEYAEWEELTQQAEKLYPKFITKHSTLQAFHDQLDSIKKMIEKYELRAGT